MTHYLLSIDQGTTSSRAVIFTNQGESISQHQIEFKQHYPADGWVEHHPEDIWETVLHCSQQAIAKAKLSAREIAAIGISNQRETTLLWDRQTGEPVYPAIVWQDRRTADFAQALQQQSGISELITQKTGLLIDPYFSATKLHWLLNHIPGVQKRAERGELAFGTVDTFLIWRLTGGQYHTTDVTNASRTLLFNIRTQQWDDELLALFAIPRQLLPEVKDSCGQFGETLSTLFGASIPITGVAGDQQAATIGQACFQPGMIKSTYGTGCFVFLNTGEEIVQSKNRLLATIAYRINGKVAYGLEGSIFIAGAAVQWLRDGLQLIKHARDTEAIAKSVTDTRGVYLIPAFTGLGAPYWNPHARGALLGLTRDSDKRHIVRATLEAICYQTRDLMDAMRKDYMGKFDTLRVDGGMAANAWLLQFLSDILHLPVEKPVYIETSSLGVAYLAGLGAGIFASLTEIAQLWSLQKRFISHMDESTRARLYAGWQQAIAKVCA